jgi:hypothetical protein
MRLNSFVRFTSRKDGMIRGPSGFDVGQQPVLVKIIIPRKESFHRDKEGETWVGSIREENSRCYAANISTVGSALVGLILHFLGWFKPQNSSDQSKSSETFCLNGNGTLNRQAIAQIDCVAIHQSCCASIIDTPLQFLKNFRPSAPTERGPSLSRKSPDPLQPIYGSNCPDIFSAEPRVYALQSATFPTKSCLIALNGPERCLFYNLIRSARFDCDQHLRVVERRLECILCLFLIYDSIC